MKRAALSLISLILAAVASCARAPAPEPAGGLSAAPAVAATPFGPEWSAGPDDGLGWFFLAEDGPRLAYGPPNSAASLMIACQGSGALSMSATTAEERSSALELSSGAARASLPVTSERDPVSGGWLMTAQTRVTDPVIDGFRRTGRLQAAGPLNAGQDDRAAVEQFFRACA